MSTAQTEITNALRDEIMIFSGQAHPAMAHEIADYLGLAVLPSETSKFSNDNLFVQLGLSVRGKEVFIIQPISAPCSDHLLELMLMLDIARGGGAKGVHAVIPYYSYARSDKKDAPRISIAGRLIADLLVTSGATHVLTMTLHSPQVHGFFRVPTDHLTAHSVFVDYLRQRDLENTVVVSPDIGNAKRAAKLARELGLPVAAGEKMRLSDNQVVVGGIMGDVRNKKVILVDDEIATGGTIVESVRVLMKESVKEITVVGTHAVFSGSAKERLDAVDEINEIVVTNTVPVPVDRLPARTKTLSVGHIFGEVIRRNALGESVGALFEFWPQSDRSKVAFSERAHEGE